MKNIVFILFLSAFCCKVQAAGFQRNWLPPVVKPNLNVVDNNILFRNIPIDRQDTVKAKKFVYAELVFQISYSVEKLWVNGKSVSQAVKNAVASAKYRDAALEVMGDDGWELVSNTIRTLDYGYEIFYYLKKEIK